MEITLINLEAADILAFAAGVANGIVDSGHYQDSYAFDDAAEVSRYGDEPHQIPARWDRFTAKIRGEGVIEAYLRWEAETIDGPYTLVSSKLVFEGDRKSFLVGLAAADMLKAVHGSVTCLVGEDTDDAEYAWIPGMLWHETMSAYLQRVAGVDYPACNQAGFDRGMIAAINYLTMIGRLTPSYISAYAAQVRLAMDDSVPKAA